MTSRLHPKPKPVEKEIRKMQFDYTDEESIEELAKNSCQYHGNVIRISIFEFWQEQLWYQGAKSPFSFRMLTGLALHSNPLRKLLFPLRWIFWSCSLSE